MRKLIEAAFLGFVLISALAQAAEAPAPSASQNLDARVQSLKQEAIDLNRDLLVLEEELLFPASTQLAVFVSFDVGVLFDLDSVELKLDNSTATHYLYTERELAALKRGGVHRLFSGNLKTGEHELVAVFTGKGPHGKDYRRGATLKFEKATGPKYVELQIRDELKKQQPDFYITQW